MNSPRKSLAEHFSSSRSQTESIQLDWENITYSTLVKDENSTFTKPVYKAKKILKGLNGQAKSGQLLAVMGPTGCGKTSFLNILAARVSNVGSKKFQLGGAIYLNGVPRNEESFRQISAYVLQDDYLYPHLTVHETLTLSANFFMATSSSQEQKETTVNMILSELGLIKAQDTIIGNDKIRGVSGGERKRTSIAVQLITDPAVFFLDEPTSGLDAFQAQSVMEAMKTLADSNRLVIAVLHQPRSSIFHMYDKLLLLSEGSTMFYGDARGCVDYFRRVGFPCPDSYNPSDYFLDIFSPDSRTSELALDAQNRIETLAAAWRSYSASEALPRDVLSLPTHKIAVREVGTAFDFIKLFRNFKLLCWRTWAEQSRDVATIRIKFISSIFFALVIGGIYSNIGFSQISIQNRIGLLFFLAINTTFNCIIAVLNSFPREMNIVGRERSGRAYDTLSYFAAKVFIEMPLNFTPSIVLSCILYWMVGLNPKVFGYFILILMLQSTVAVSLGLAISAVAPNVESAVAFGPVLVIIGILFGGFYIKIDSLPIVANWIPYMSSLRWCFEALVLNEFAGLSFDCGTLPLSACTTTGEQVIANLGFASHTTAYPCFGLGMLLATQLLASLVLLSLNKPTYLPLNHTGATILGYLDQEAAVQPPNKQLQPKKLEVEMTTVERAGVEKVTEL